MAGAVIIGAGPGIGRSVARRFAREGLPVGLVARDPRRLAALAGEVDEVGEVGEVATAPADAADEGELRAALDKVAAALGPPDVLVYNAAVIRPDVLGELPARAHLDIWSVNVLGAQTAAAHVLPGMAERGHGTFVVTGGMPEPKPAYLSLSVGKAAVRSLVALLDLQYRPACT